MKNLAQTLGRRIIEKSLVPKIDDKVVPEARCPHCQKPCDRATGRAENTPGEGAISICINCGGISEFDADLNLRLLAPEKEAEVRADPEAKAFLAVVQKIIDGRSNA